MPSPFPGMDPYLEAHWRDVHARLAVYACDALQSVLPASLRIRVEEKAVFPALDVPRISSAASFQCPPIAGPIIVDAEPAPITEPYLEIIDRAGDHCIVTVIDFLSPASKIPGTSRVQYLKRQQQICYSDTNLVEIDLNRFGAHTLAFPLTELDSEYRTTYLACVRRAHVRGKAEVYSMPLAQRLPTLKIPLRPKDADVPLDLQALIEQCYRNGGYEGTLDYAAEPEPPLLEEEKEWVHTRLHEQGLRKKPPRKRRPPQSR